MQYTRKAIDMIESNNPSAIRSKNEINNALITLMKDYPYNEITVKQIILEARLARKTFYRNYTSKDDVLISVVKKAFDAYFDVINNAKGTVIDTVFSFADKNKELLSLLDKNNLLYLTLQYITDYFIILRDKKISESNPFTKLFDGLDSDYLIALNIGAIWNVITLWVHNDFKDNPENVKSTISMYLLRLKNI